MISWHNGTVPSHQEEEESADEYQRSECVLGYIPVIYYSILLCVGVPVNVLTLVALSRLAARTQKALYVYLLALTGSDILSQLFIIFVGFLLETAVFHRDVPVALLRSVSALEFAANHASIWATVPLTVDRYVALCHPLLHRQISYPARARRIITVVLTLALASGVPFFWWSDVWRVSRPPNTLDSTLIWVHVTIIYFLPCSVFLVLNSLIILRLRRRQHQQRCQEDSRQQRAAAGRLGKTTAMLLAITSVFTVLWAPRTAVVLYHLYVSSVHRDWRVHLAYDLANMLAMLNTAVNFFLYCFVSKPFREVVKDVLLLRGAPLHPPRSFHHRHTSANTSNSSLSSNAKRSHRDATPLSALSADIIA
ncbi:LOW QUALITY PROTEIN: probable G-protein coupled receptor 142 [Colossoma macropomum]|uniref:LOW QUALITY PROTEIN: probable G-protein coupled receptor 142 n=1 Tax=Colossoma macropomum TaxID=42526 RepID=UPI0018645385|nr:LOW QUALITY PROTEIN: probable G-protein coupled receptor 142 [Colossoma macropomum]